MLKRTTRPPPAFTSSANSKFVFGAVTAIFIASWTWRNGAPPNMLALLCFDTLGYVPSHLHPRVSAQVHRRHALLSASDASAPPAAPLPTPARLLLSRRAMLLTAPPCRAAMAEPPTERFLSEGSHWPGSQTTVGEHMTAGVVTFLPTTTLKEAAMLMNEKAFYGVPVAEEGKLLGVLSRGDIIKALAEAPFREDPTDEMCAADDEPCLQVLQTRLEGIESMPVQNAMNPFAVTISPDATMLDASKLMFEKRCAHCPCPPPSPTCVCRSRPSPPQYLQAESVGGGRRDGSGGHPELQGRDPDGAVRRAERARLQRCRRGLIRGRPGCACRKRH